jgi:hypothetical protein
VSAYLLLSYHHALLPLAKALTKEGATAEHIPWRQRYERAWEGSLESPLKGEPKRDDETLGSVVAAAREGVVTVLLDHPKWAEKFAGSPNLYGVAGEHRPTLSPLRACGWWDGERLHAPHLLMVDLGAWAGGFGPAVEGAATLVRGYARLVAHCFTPLADEVKASGHRGLVQVYVGNNAEALGWSGGWTPLHLHAFMTQVESTKALLSGEPPALPFAYSVAVPVTVPPWPLRCDRTSQEQPVRVAPEVLGNVTWHDVRVSGGELQVAGLDGFVGVARGRAQSLTLARRRAVATAEAVPLSERQFRPDAGSRVQTVLETLAEAGWAP